MKSRVAIFLGLNTVRFFSVIALILVFAASIVTLVHDIRAIQHAGSVTSSSNSTDTNGDFEECMDYLDGSTVPNQPAGAFWAIVNRFLIIFEIIILFMSEVGWPMKFFQVYFPVLGPDFGVGAIGIFECLIGAAILSHRMNEFAIVAAFFLFSVGCLTILMGLIFRESSRTRRSLTEWYGEPALPTTMVSRDQLASGAASFISNAEKAHLPMNGVPIHSAQPTGSSYASATPIHNEYAYADQSFKGYGFGRAAAKNIGEKSGLKGFIITRPVEAAPRYASRPSSGGEREVPGAF